MKNQQPHFSLLPQKFFLLLFVLFATACAHYSNVDKEDDLQNRIYQFNKRFEARMMELSASYLPMDKRQEFLVDSLKIKENVTFLDSSVLGVQLYDNDIPVQINADGPDQEFNKAIVTMRYQMAILPSNQVKIIQVDHLWRWQEQEWYVVPDLESFLK